MVQLMQQYEVIVISLMGQTIKRRTLWLQFHLLIRRPFYPNTNPKYRSNKSKIDKTAPHIVWRELFSPLHALNFGIGGDTTCNVLWRLQNGELENISPKVVVLWVGTNNHEHTADQVAGGILAIAQLLLSCLPKSKIIVLGLLPRGEFPNPLREKNASVNNLLRASLPRLGPVQLLDVGGSFVHSDGTISSRDMFDFLHLTAGAYRTISTTLHELLLQLLEETPQERRASLV